MKQFLALLSAVALFACNSESKPNAETLDAHDKTMIEAQTTLHNLNVGHKYRTEANNEAGLFKARHYGMPKAKIEQLTAAHMDSFARAWGTPYDISKDSTVDMAKYLEYCKSRGANPKTEHKYFD